MIGELMRNGLLILGAFVLMIACGVGAMLSTASYFMSLGMRRHDNYEHYGQTPAVVLILFAGLIGFACPGVVIWCLRNNHWRVSVRNLLIATTLSALLLGVFVFLLKVAAMH